MFQEKAPQSDPRSTEFQSSPEQTALDRVKELQEKTRRLDEALDRVEKTLGEAAGESRAS